LASLTSLPAAALAEVASPLLVPPEEVLLATVEDLLATGSLEVALPVILFAAGETGSVVLVGEEILTGALILQGRFASVSAAFVWDWMVGPEAPTWAGVIVCVLSTILYSTVTTPADC